MSSWAVPTVNNLKPFNYGKFQTHTKGENSVMNPMYLSPSFNLSIFCYSYFIQSPSFSESFIANPRHHNISAVNTWYVLLRDKWLWGLIVSQRSEFRWQTSTVTLLLPSSALFQHCQKVGVNNRLNDYSASPIQNVLHLSIVKTSKADG